MLEYKLSDRGKYFVKVDKWFASSQICHCCGARHTEMKDLSIRTMKCNCGLIISRDKNAAINIKDEIAVFGNCASDISMLSEYPFSVAVNADEKTKQTAKYVID